MLKPVTVKALSNYKLYIKYEDGVEGEVDLSDLAGKGVFSLWNDKKAFEKVSIGENGEIKWTDQIDICPDAMYMKITGKSLEEIFAKFKKASTHA